MSESNKVTVDLIIQHVCRAVQGEEMPAPFSEESNAYHAALKEIVSPDSVASGLMDQALAAVGHAAVLALLRRTRAAAVCAKAVRASGRIQ